MAGDGFVQVSGVQKKIAGIWVQVNGVWKTVDQVWVQENLKYSKAWSNNFAKPNHFSYSSSITRGQTITWTTDNIDGADYEIQTSYDGGQSWSASQFFDLPTGQITITTDVTKTTVCFRLRVVAQTTHDKQSSWLQGPVVNLIAQKLAAPTGLTYTNTIARGDKVRVYWDVSDTSITYNLHVVYNDGNNNVSDTVAYSSKVSQTGQTYYDYNVSTDTKWNYIQFRVIAQKTGYFDSDIGLGPTVTLTGQTLAIPGNLAYPAPYWGQSITISWDSVTNAGMYQLEVNFGSGLSRIYWGANRSFTYTVPDTMPSGGSGYIQFRVKATNMNYTDSDWNWGNSLAVNPPPLKSKTWKASATHNWRDNFGGQWDGDYAQPDFMQGQWNDGSTTWGNYQSIAMFDYNDIRNTLAGKTIAKVEVYLYRLSTSHGYSSGQPVLLYMHNYSSLPAGRPTLTPNNNGPASSFTRGDGHWITVNNSVAEQIRDGSQKGIGLYSPTGSYYARFSSSNVQLYVEYR